MFLFRLKSFLVWLRNEPHDPNNVYINGTWWTPRWVPEDEYAWQHSVFADTVDLDQLQRRRREWLTLNS